MDLAANRYTEQRAPVVPRDAARWNLDALDSLLRLAHYDGAEVLLYKPPHRPGWQTFYHDRERYDAFAQALEARSRRGGFRYLDLEAIVPERYWGTTNQGQPDVFHFSDDGHRRLAQAIDGELSGGEG